MIDPKELSRWCKLGPRDLAKSPDCKIKFRLVWDSNEMSLMMAKELADLVEANNRQDKPTRVIISVEPINWYQQWVKLVNSKNISLKNLHVFHMDEFLDWQARPLPKGHPYNSRSFMENHFYGDIRSDLNVPEEQRHWLSPATIEAVRMEIARVPADLAMVGWGPDGAIGGNQAAEAFRGGGTVQELAESSVRIQVNTPATILAMGEQTFGSAWQLAPPMSITLGMKELLSAVKVRAWNDEIEWRQSPLRIALFSSPTSDCPLSLLQRHSDALITATMDAAKHPINEHGEWEI